MTLAFGSIVEQNTLPPHRIIFKLRVTNTVTVRNFGFASDRFNIVAYMLLRGMKYEY